MTTTSDALVECIPNFSEGRRQDVIRAIVDAIRFTPGVNVLDVSSDVDHNRTVVTFVGPPAPVADAAYRGIDTAMHLINLDNHSGVHPRIGAADVVPFVPLRNVSMRSCVELARALGQHVAQTLKMPVYLYEQAALRPERANLAEVRRHPYEQLRFTIAADPTRAPDYGPAQLGKAGAVAIGARGPLIAFNAYLNTDDVRIAQAIARTVRTSGGGLPHLKALGLLVNGQAQVSMNVVDYRQTSLYTILERVRAEATKHNVTVTHTELVGLIPQAALLASAVAYLGLPPTTRTLTLENRIGAVSSDYREIHFE